MSNKEITKEELLIKKQAKKIYPIYSTLYSNFEHIKKEFLICFNPQTELIDFDKFIFNIKYDLSEITTLIRFEIFNDNKNIWSDSDTEDWLLKCFFKYKVKKDIRPGYIIELYFMGRLNNYFHNECIQRLYGVIMKKLKYHNAKKRQCDCLLSMDENFNEFQLIENIYDDLLDMDSLLVYDKFKNKLKKNEKKIFDILLNMAYIQSSYITYKDISDKLKLSRKTIHRNINSIKEKLINYN